MTKEPRGAVISIRFSDDEQAQLRELAAEQGRSVSDLIRSLVASEIGPELPTGTTIPATPGPLNSDEHGVLWFGDAGTIEGATLTIGFGA